MARPLPLWPGFTYKPHQLTGIRWMLNREQQPNAGGLLCDEMGLGKTMEILGLIKNSPSGTSLLLCPKVVISQWVAAASRSGFWVFVSEASEWVPAAGCVPPAGSTHYLYIANYEKLSRSSLFDMPWDRVVLDEAHRVVNNNGVSYKKISALERRATWAVTATPVINKLKDIRNLFGLVGYDMNALTDYEYQLNVMNEACLHRSMEEMRPVLKELPEAAVIKKQVLDFETEEEATFYRSIQGVLLPRWKALEADASPSRFALIMKLRQLSIHPQVYINARKKSPFGYSRTYEHTSSTKFSALRKIMEATKKPTRWIIFNQFHDEMNLLQAWLETSPAVKRVQQYHGEITDAEKDAVIKATFDEVDGHDVLLLQLQSGGVGLNLQHFTKVVFMSPWWTSALMDQAIGRAVRIGQTEKVEVIHLMLKEEMTMNIDRMMMEKADEKRSILEKLFVHASRGDMPRPVAQVDLEEREAN